MTKILVDAYTCFSEQEGFDEVEITADMVGRFHTVLHAYNTAAEILTSHES